MECANVRTLSRLENTRYQHVSKDYIYDISGLREVRWTDLMDMVVKLFGQEAKLTKEGRNDAIRKSTEGLKRLLSSKRQASFKGYPRDITMIVANAPTTDDSEEEIEALYEAVEKVMDEILSY